MLLNMEVAETKELSLTSGLLQAVVLGVLLSDRHPSHLPACLPSPGCSFWGGEPTPEHCCVTLVLLRTTLLAELAKPSLLHSGLSRLFEQAQSIEAALLCGV